MPGPAVERLIDLTQQEINGAGRRRTRRAHCPTLRRLSIEGIPDLLGMRDEDCVAIRIVYVELAAGVVGWIADVAHIESP